MSLPEGAVYSKGYKLWGGGEEVDGVHKGEWRWYTEDGAIVFSRLHRPDGRPEKDSHYYKEDSSLYVEMNYDLEGKGSPVVYVNHDFDWRVASVIL